MGVHSIISARSEDLMLGDKVELGVELRVEYIKI